MTRIIALSLMMALGAGGAFASNSGKLDDAKRAEITTLLTGQGYEVRKIDIEDGQFEVYAIKDGKKMELYLDDALTVIRTKSAD